MNDIEQFRKDFALVWKWWIARAEETAESYQAAGLAVKRRMRDVEWLRGAMAHFATLADAIRRDLARSERIRAEMRADKEKANGGPLPELFEVAA